MVPNLHQQVVGLFEALPVEQRVDVGRQALNTGAPDETGHQPAPGDHVDFSQLFGQPEGVVEDRQGVAQQYYLGRFGIPGEDGRLQVHGGPQAGGGVVVLV